VTTPEGKLKNSIKAFLKDRGAYYHMPVLTGYGVPTLDFVGCFKGRFFAVETKAPGQRPSARQNFTMAEMNKAGGLTVWVDNIDDFVRWWDLWLEP
jgi:hypothetical protein